MAFIPATNIVRVAIEYLLDGQNLANVFHVDAGSSPDATVINAIIDVFADWVTDELLALLSEDVEVTGFTAKDLTTATGIQIERPLSPPQAGTDASPSLPNNVALVVTWFTTLGGRSFRGRTYLPGLSEGIVTLSEITTLAAADYALAAIDLVNDLTAESFDLVVTSFQTGNAPRAAAVSTPISAAGVNVVTDSQRRRLPGRGD